MNSIELTISVEELDHNHAKGSHHPVTSDDSECTGTCFVAGDIVSIKGNSELILADKDTLKIMTMLALVAGNHAGDTQTNIMKAVKDSLVRVMTPEITEANNVNEVVKICHRFACAYELFKIGFED